LGTQNLAERIEQSLPIPKLSLFREDPMIGHLRQHDSPSDQDTNLHGVWQPITTGRSTKPGNVSLQQSMAYSMVNNNLFHSTNNRNIPANVPINTGFSIGAGQGMGSIAPFLNFEPSHESNSSTSESFHDKNKNSGSADGNIYVNNCSWNLSITPNLNYEPMDNNQVASHRLL
jgi:hypothetical protein